MILGFSRCCFSFFLFVCLFWGVIVKELLRVWGSLALPGITLIHLMGSDARSPRAAYKPVTRWFSLCREAVPHSSCLQRIAKGKPSCRRNRKPFKFSQSKGRWQLCSSSVQTQTCWVWAHCRVTAVRGTRGGCRGAWDTQEQGQLWAQAGPAALLLQCCTSPSFLLTLWDPRAETRSPRALQTEHFWE